MAKISAKFDRLPYGFFKDDKTKNNALRVALNLAEQGLSYDDAIEKAMAGAFSPLAEEALNEMIDEGFFSDWKDNRRHKRIEKAQAQHDDELSYEIDLASIEAGNEDPRFSENRRTPDRMGKEVKAYLSRLFKSANKYIRTSLSDGKEPASKIDIRSHHLYPHVWSSAEEIRSIVRINPKLMHIVDDFLSDLSDSRKPDDVASYRVYNFIRNALLEEAYE